MNAIIATLTKHWPTARHIRHAGCCPDCKADAQWSFQIDDSDTPVPNMQGWEYCGYWCAVCGWSNAGTRPIDEAAVQ
jgi:hypothetical protein